MGLYGRCLSKLRIRRQIIREFLAELLGTYVLICFGTGASAQAVLSTKLLDQPWSQGFVSLTWGMGVAMGVYVSAGVSGGHINPAVSLALASVGKFTLWKVPIYWLAQYLGAFLGAATVYGVYYELIDEFDGGTRYVEGVNATAGFWSTYPIPSLSTGACMIDQIVGTGILMLCILAITDEKNNAAPKGVVGLAVGLCVYAIGTAFGMSCGFAINPARDLGPRIFSAIAGWGTDVFTVYNNYSWVPVLGPHVGAILGAYIYYAMVELHEDPDEDDDDDDEGEDKAQYSMSTVCETKQY